MEEKRLAYRMYFFVPYNISPIQQAIQAGHAALEYAYKFCQNKEYVHFIENDKTWIILNGGTTNSQLQKSLSGESFEPMGSLNRIHEDLWKNKVDHSLFNEPDLNNALTAVCFLADERVWNYETYPDFFDFIVNVKMTPESAEQMPAQNYLMLKKQSLENLQGMFPEYYTEWVAFLGGEKNLFLRNLLRGKKLA